MPHLAEQGSWPRCIQPRRRCIHTCLTTCVFLCAVDLCPCESFSAYLKILERLDYSLIVPGVFVHCDIRTNAEVGVLVQDEGTKPHLEHCQIYQNKTSGVSVFAKVCAIVT